MVPPMSGASEHDIAMLEFDVIRLTNKFRPICLPM